MNRLFGDIYYMSVRSQFKKNINLLFHAVIYYLICNLHWWGGDCHSIAVMTYIFFSTVRFVVEPRPTGAVTPITNTPANTNICIAFVQRRTNIVKILYKCLCLLGLNGVMKFARRRKGFPSKHKTLSHCWFNVGPLSTTLAQHRTSNGLLARCQRLEL